MSTPSSPAVLAVLAKCRSAQTRSEYYEANKAYYSLPSEYRTLDLAAALANAHGRTVSTPHAITTGIVRVVTNDKGDVVERVVVTDVSPTGHAWTETTQIPVGDGEWWNIEIRRMTPWSR